MVRVACVLSLWSAFAFAQPPPPEESAEAIFEAGVRAMERSDWVAAEMLFRQVYEQDPSPRVRLNLAQSMYEQNELLAARTEAEAVAHGDDLLLQDAAQQLVAEIDRAMAHLELRAQGIAAGDASFRVDGRVAAASAPVDPGEHVVALFDGDRFVAEETVTVRRGERREVVLTPDLSAEGVARANGQANPPPLLGGDEARVRRRRRMGFGIAAAILIVGAVALGVGFGVARNDDPGGDVDAIVFDLMSR